MIYDYELGVIDDKVYEDKDKRKKNEIDIKKKIETANKIKQNKKPNLDKFDELG